MVGLGEQPADAAGLDRAPAMRHRVGGVDMPLSEAAQQGDDVPTQEFVAFLPVGVHLFGGAAVRQRPHRGRGCLRRLVRGPVQEVAGEDEQELDTGCRADHGREGGRHPSVQRVVGDQERAGDQDVAGQYDGQLPGGTA